MATEICQYCGVDLDEVEPRRERGWTYGVECSRCPADRRRSQVLARAEHVKVLSCPQCGSEIAEDDPDVLVVKELTYEVCAACGERCGVASVRKLRDHSGGTM